MQKNIICDFLSEKMGNIKAKTHLQKLGFADNDKKKPTHDIIQTWVYENIETIVAETAMNKRTEPYELTPARWEHQVIYRGSNTYKTVVGFVDIYVGVKGIFHFKHSNGDTTYSEERVKPVFIEVKTEIPSLGELIRQMRAYQAYQDNFASYIIVSPDDRHKKILEEQGFHFYKYKDPSLLF